MAVASVDRMVEMSADLKDEKMAAKMAAELVGSSVERMGGLLAVRLGVEMAE